MLNWFRKSPKPETYSEQGVPEFRQFAHRGTAGISVNERTALNFSAVWACVRLISETEATLPFPVYQRLESGGKQRDRSHPVHQLLNGTPDGIISSLQWREAMVAHVLTHGNAYSEIEFAVDGTPIGLHLLPPNMVTPERTKSGDVIYKLDGSPVKVPAQNIVHIAGLGFDGLVGYSPIKMGARAIGLGLATEAFGSAWFENGAKGAGVLSSPKTLTPEARKNIKQSLSDIHGGPENYGGWMFFEEGITATTLGIPPEESQFLQTRTMQIQEICRLYRVDPALIGELSRSTFSNVEQQSLNFVVHCIRPWCVRIEAEINRKLFADSDEYFAEHLIDGLTRGDTATRYSAYNIGRLGGWLCIDEIREMENLNPLPDGQGKVYLTPLNMAPASTVSQPEASPVTQPTPEAVQASWDCVQDNVDRMLRRESEGIKSALKRDNPAQAVREFWESHQIICERALQPSLKAYASLVTSDLGECMAILGLPQRMVASGLAQTLDAIERKQQIEAVFATRQTTDWRKT